MQYVILMRLRSARIALPGLCSILAWLAHLNVLEGQQGLASDGPTVEFKTPEKKNSTGLPHNGLSTFFSGCVWPFDL